MAKPKAKAKPAKPGAGKPRSGKAKPLAATARATAADAKHVSVRMYNVGFGDSFLLSFPAPDRPRWVLIDCGVHPSGPGPRAIGDVVGDILADVTRGGNARIDVVIATHRHADHVSGFGDARWDDVEVGEVWMPWTENPKDPEGRTILEKQSKASKHLAMTPGLAPEVKALADNQLVNADAMATLHGGFRGNAARRFLPERDKPPRFESPQLPGVTVHVLGPSFDPDVIRDMNPGKNEAYLARLSQDAATGDKPLLPFAETWRFPSNALPDFMRPLALRDPDVARIANLNELDLFGVAVALEGAVNGTSLVLLFEIGRASLLFCGDAQWGTWKAIYDDTETRALVAKTTFYKVGHHGSHNATYPKLVDQLGGFLGMVSTRAKTKDWDIPRRPLLVALRAESELRHASPVIRSDRADVPDPDGVDRDAANRYVDTKVRI